MQTEIVKQAMAQFCADYDARRIAAEIAVRLKESGQIRELFALLHATLGWDDDHLTITFACRDDALLVRPHYRAIARVIGLWEVKEAILNWDGSMHQGFRVIASLAGDDDVFAIPPPLDMNASITEAMRIGDMVRGSENPIGVVLLDSDWQIWGNQALSVMTGKPLEELIRMNVRANWVDRRKRTDDGLAEIKDRLISEGDFEVAYRTKMSGDAAIKHDFESRFRLMLDGRVRVTEIYSYVPAP